jgi:hypothetical protein
MKKGIFVGALVTLLCIPSYAYAKGSGAIKFEGQNNVNVGDEFKVNMVIDNVSEAEDGVVGFGGYISFDTDLLEIIDAKSANEYFTITRNKNINKIAGIDYSLANGINNRSTVYEITFRGLNEGNTTITMKNAELVDKKANELDVTTNGLNVKINKKEEVKPVETIKKVEKKQTQEAVVESSIENKEDIVIEKTVKETKKASKNTIKVKKSGNIITRFFKKLFNKIIKK